MIDDRVKESDGTEAGVAAGQPAEVTGREPAQVAEGPARRVLSRRALFGLAVGAGIAPVVISSVATSFDLNRAGVFEAARNQVRHVTPGRLAVGIELVFPWQLRVDLVRDPAFFPGVLDATVTSVTWAGGRVDVSGLDRPAGPRADRLAFDLARSMPMVGDMRSWSVRFRSGSVDPTISRVRITSAEPSFRFALTYRNEHPLEVLNRIGQEPQLA